VLLIENSRSCAGKRLYDSILWFCSREFTTLKVISRIKMQRLKLHIKIQND
jgi:hypothetical protein